MTAVNNQTTYMISQQAHYTGWLSCVDGHMVIDHLTGLLMANSGKSIYLSVCYRQKISSRL